MRASFALDGAGTLESWQARRTRTEASDGHTVDNNLSKILGGLTRNMGARATCLLWHPAGKQAVVLAACRDSADDDQAFAALTKKMTDKSSSRVSDGQWEPIFHCGDPALLMTSALQIAEGIVTFGAIVLQHAELVRASFAREINSLLPVLEGCVALWKQSQARALQVRALTVAIDNSAFGVVLLDVERAIMLVNATAERLLTSQDGIRRVGKSIGGIGLGDSVRLQTAIDHVINIRTKPETTICAVQRAEGKRPLIIAVSPVPAASGAVDCAALLQVIDPSRDFEPLLEPVCKHYGLSPVETRLAVSLTLGLSLIEAAKTMRLREATARSYLKQIFLKTDINRQSELVGILLKSCVPATLAHG